MVQDRRVLIVGNFFESGTRQVCQDLFERLRTNKWKVYKTSRYENRLYRLFDMLYCTWKLRFRYDVAQVDVFSGLAFFWAEAVTALLTLLKKPYILTLHGGNLPQFSRRKSKRVRRVLLRASFVTTPSRYLLEQMQEYCSNLLLIPNPIDVNVYTSRQQLVARPRLIWLRAFSSIYNPVLAAEVLCLLTNEFPDIHLRMIGPNSEDRTFRDFEAKVGIWGLESRIDVVGGVAKTDVPQQLQQGDIFLNTTNVDNTPVSVIEALASGLCVVSTNVGGIPYLLEDERDALLVPPSNPEAMADAVRRILTEPGLAERLSRNARAKAEQFDWSNILPQWEKLLADVIEDHQQGVH